MRIRLTVEKLCRQIRSRLLTSKLERMAGEMGPGSFRTPEFLDAEMRLGLALAGLAAVEFESGGREAGQRVFDRAEQIYTALRRCLPGADLDAADRGALERRMARLETAMARVTGMATAA